MTRLALVVNPSSRAAHHAVGAVSAAVQEAGLGEPLVLSTTPHEPGGPQTRYAVARGVERVVVAGGDGTVREVAGALSLAILQSSPSHRVPLGVVPVGTANLFARSALLPVGDVREAARRAVTGGARPTDLGRARLTSATGGVSEHAFLVVAGVGHDAATLAAVRPAHKANVRWLAYFLPGVLRLGRPGHALRLVVDGERVHAGPLWTVLAVNAARLPGGIRVVPGAHLDDGLLHTVLVSPRTLLDWGRIAVTGMGRVTPGDHPALRYRTGRELVVDAPEPVLAQVDGDVVPDIVGARVTVLPGALDVAR
ncbi:diacylglycerol/lipid kinase family protein [Ornithinimicrobium pekingense]|uniref:Sphingosine kinase n=1 Tax=Ornithinimicrobium pekingense TaxID=384677 RepID=A0ABQ2F815_9MICO|nr:diacylglycerol kinase family protein [Ornithinimicrobium pekingense]GGK70466.1 sphingosine kinase [Ornithinimicrobium pekingense]